MAVMTVAPTVGRRTNRGTPAQWRKRRSRSYINRDFLDPRIGDVLEVWEGPPATADAVPQLRIVAAPMVREYPQTAVDAVEFIRDLLDVSQDAVLASVGIQERTYFGWKSNRASRPRVSSLGKLWLMVEALFGLEPHRPNLAAWFHSTPEAQRAFASGDVSRLQLLELQAAAVGRPELLPDVRLFGDPGDPTAVGESVVESVRPARPAVRKRTTPTSKVPPRPVPSE